VAFFPGFLGVLSFCGVAMDHRNIAPARVFARMILAERRRRD
jgi:hypothetical protein